MRQRKRCAHLLPGCAAAALAAATISARADVLSEMQRFWDGAAVNTTGPTAFEGQASGHWTLGNLYLRAPVQSERIGTVSLPSFRAGCGGIDAFAGAFSFIDSDQLVAFARGIAQNATGFAFDLALETISPVIAETMSKLRALAQWVNNQSINSCEMAQSPGRGRLVHQRPGECLDLRGHRDIPGDFFRLCGRSARLRVGRAKIFDIGSGDGRAGGSGAGERQLRLGGGAGFGVSVCGSGVGGVRDVDHRDRSSSRRP